MVTTPSRASESQTGTPTQSFEAPHVIPTDVTVEQYGTTMLLDDRVTDRAGLRFQTFQTI